MLGKTMCRTLVGKDKGSNMKCPTCGQIIYPKPVTSKSHMDNLTKQWYEETGEFLLLPSMEHVTKVLSSAGIGPEMALQINMDDFRAGVEAWHGMVKKAGVGRRPGWGIGYVRTAFLNRMDKAREQDKKQEKKDAESNTIAVQIAKARKAEDEFVLIQRWWETVPNETKRELFIKQQKELNLTSTTEKSVMRWAWTKRSELWTE